MIHLSIFFVALLTHTYVGQSQTVFLHARLDALVRAVNGCMYIYIVSVLKLLAVHM